MAKRRITITIDDDVLEALEGLGGTNLSATASDLLRQGVVARAHQAALLDWLDQLDEEHGAPSAAHEAAAEALLDEAEGLAARAS